MQLTLLTSMFLHGGWLHLIFNMMFLGFVGRNVEHLLGRGWYLSLYLFSGFAAGAVYIALAPNSRIPCLGASGAISGVMMALLMLFPEKKVRMFLWFIIPLIVDVPVWLAVITYFFIDMVMTLARLPTMGQTGGVAYAAHLGGAAGGALFVLGRLIWLFRQEPERKPKAPAPAEEEPVRPLTGRANSLQAAPGQELDSVVAWFRDNHQAGPPEAYSAAVTWGDGSRPERGKISTTAEGDFAVTGRHCYASPGFYVVSVVVVRRGAEPGQDGGAVKVVSSANVSSEFAAPRL